MLKYFFPSAVLAVIICALIWAIYMDCTSVEVRVTGVSRLYRGRGLSGEFCTITGTREDGTPVTAQLEARKCVLAEPGSLWRIRRSAVMR